MTRDKTSKKRTAAPRLPGDLDKDALIDRMLRVDHAGEYGARRIYEGQLAVLGRRPSAETIRHMHAQEQEHLAHFESTGGGAKGSPDRLATLVAHGRTSPWARPPP